MYTTAMVIATVLGLYALADPYLQTSEAIVYQQVVSRRYVTETLEQKNKKLNELKARESELLKATSEWNKWSLYPWKYCRIWKCMENDIRVRLFWGEGLKIWNISHFHAICLDSGGGDCREGSRCCSGEAAPLICFSPRCASLKFIGFQKVAQLWFEVDCFSQ